MMSTSSKLLTFFLLFMIGCVNSEQIREQQINVSKDLNFPIYKYEVENKDTFYVGDSYLKGRARIVLKETGSNDKGEFRDFTQSCECYTLNDTIRISFGISHYKMIHIDMSSVKYIGQAEYSTDIINSYDNGSYSGTFLKLMFKKSNLVVKEASLEKGDTLFGYLDLETEKYKVHNLYFADYYKGPFVCIIKGSRSKY